MSTESSPAHADLAYLKALVDGDVGSQQAAFGRSYLIAGVLYGVQIILQWADYAEIIPLSGPPYLAVVSLPTIVFLSFVTWQGWRERKARAASPANRAIKAAFQATGLANLAVITMLVVLGGQRQDGVIILLYPAIIFIFQGAAWFVAYRLRHRIWMLGVALGWLVSGVAMGVTLGSFNLHAYIAIATFDMWVLMALPGAVMLHLARKASS